MKEKDGFVYTEPIFCGKTKMSIETKLAIASAILNMISFLCLLAYCLLLWLQ